MRVRHPRELWKDIGGVALIEFAVALPFLILLILGGVDLVRFVITNQTLGRVTGFVGDFVAREEFLTSDSFAEFFAAAQLIAAPLEMSTKGRLVITGVRGGTDGNPVNARILWQRAGGGTLVVSSGLGGVGEKPDLPSPIALADGQGLIVTEVFFRFDPLFLPDLVAGRVLSIRSFHRPRLVNLLEITGP